MLVFLDFETRSTEDIKTAGAHRYAAHPSTEIICMAYAIDDGPVKVWFHPRSLPQDFAAAYVSGATFVAHNAPFEQQMWKNNTDLLLSPSPTNWICTAARAAAMGLPRNLGDAAEALGLPFKKDLLGRSLAIKMSKPRSLDPLVWWDQPDKLINLYNYCADDVRATRALYHATRALDADELETYRLDQTMNNRGVNVDLPLVYALREIALVGITRANAVIAACTGGDVEKVTQLARMQRWLVEQGVTVDNLTKATVSETLEQGGLPPNVEKVLTVRAEAGRTSIAKLDAIDRGIDSFVWDGALTYQMSAVLHGLLSYHGAHTGRWAGRRVQPQNFPRGTVKDPEFFIDLVLQNEYEIINVLDNPLNVVSSLLRATLIPRDGNRFVIGDFSSIEAIVLAWLAGQSDLVGRFRSGENVYKVEGERVGATRQHGKAILLGCGFGMGAPKFIEAAKNMFGLDVSQAQATEFVNGYRDRYTKIPTFWYELQDAFIDVVERTKDEATVGGLLTVKRRGRNLWIVLPSGRAMCYHKVRHDDGQLSIMRVHPETKQWQRRTIWGGFLAENVTQAVARDVMVASMKRLEAAGYPLVLTVHDEIIADVPNQHGSLQDFLQTMAVAPSWADDLPVLANGFEAQRYRKG